jgi:pilus assembly protein FimV
MAPATPAAAAAAAGVAGAMGLNERVQSAVKAAETKFDLDFKLDEADKPAPIQKPREPVLEGATVGGAPAQLARPAAALELDKLDLSFDPDRSTFEDPTPSVLDGQWHDAATKLDLAKAYQEMGDVEGAREILQEVLHEGDDQQKAEAKSLLSKLS